jgi:substrate import-associated zinc metallohydrolase lipoprotein
MNTKILSVSLALILATALSCKDPYNTDLDESKLDFATNDQPPATELDNWLNANFTQPYNIEVKYRWSANEVNINNTLVPPIPEKVSSIMSVVHDAWIEPYLAEAGETFFKTFTPKQFVLVGSPNYNPGGTITLGTAEAGRKIVLFVINDFNENDRAKIKEQMHTVHHEFAHILHQNIPYTANFKEITKGAYTADWYNIPTSVAQSRGFITSYAMSGPDEDFVELVAMMLTEGKRGFERIVCSIPSATAQAQIRQKQQIVINYFNDVYKIDFFKLQQRTEAAIDAYAAKSLISDLGFASGQNFYGIMINPSELPTLPAGFKSIYDQAAANLSGSSLTLDFVLIAFLGDNELVVQYGYHDTDGTDFVANFFYDMTVDANQVVKLTRTEQSNSAEDIEIQVGPLINYFENNTFKFDYIPHDADGCVYDWGGVFPQGSPSTNAFGQLIN